jgi:large subunit ribosomal protein L21
MYAVIETGGKQYQVSPGDKIRVELLEQLEGTVTFDRVLLVKTDEAVKVGTPTVKGATVQGEIVRALKADKIIIFKKIKSKQYRRTRGHRQNLLEVLVREIKGV